jgi:dipeptidase E
MGIKIFLGGGGDEKQAREIDDLYGQTVGQGAKILYIPVAWTNPNEFDSCLVWFRKAYARFEFQIEMLTDLNGVQIDYLEQFDSVYIGGGNTFLLLKTLNETGFTDLLKKFIDSGKVVYGGSAGAIILGKDIKTAFVGNCSDDNDVQLTDFSGLDLVNGHAVHCHYGGELEVVKKFANENSVSILAIPENGGVFVDGDAFKIIGKVDIVPCVN